MKDNKVERIQQKIAMFRQQFLQDDGGIFSQALGEQELVAVMIDAQRELNRVPWGSDSIDPLSLMIVAG